MARRSASWGGRRRRRPRPGRPPFFATSPPAAVPLPRASPGSPPPAGASKASCVVAGVGSSGMLVRIGRPRFRTEPISPRPRVPGRAGRTRTGGRRNVVLTNNAEEARCHIRRRAPPSGPTRSATSTSPSPVPRRPGRPARRYPTRPGRPLHERHPPEPHLPVRRPPVRPRPLRHPRPRLQVRVHRPRLTADGCCAR